MSNTLGATGRALGAPMSPLPVSTRTSPEPSLPADVTDILASTLTDGARLDVAQSDRLAHLLPHVTRDEMVAVAATAIGLPAASVALEKASGGASGASVSFIDGPGDKRVAVIKQTKTPVDMARTAEGMVALNNPAIGFHLVHSPRVLAVGMTGDQQGLIEMTLAPGRTLADIPPAERSPQCELTGAALAELHSLPAGSQTHVPTAYAQAQVAKLGVVLQKLAKNQDQLPQFGLSLAAIQSEAEKSATAFTADPGLNAVVHGDYHPGNVVVDDKGMVNIIDSSHLPESLDHLGRPNGAPARDVAQFWYRLERDGRTRNASTADIQAAQSAFERGYGQQGQHITPAALHFCTILVALEELAYITDGRNPQANARCQREGLGTTINAILGGGPK